LILARAERWERELADHTYLTQPLGGGRVRDYSWAEAVGEARRIAAYLRGLDFPPGSRIAILSKNCAHFVMSDLAIWMAGHVSVALYPTLDAETARYILEHSGSRLLFVGKLDGWPTIKPGVPDGLPCLAYSLSPPGHGFPVWEEIVARTPPFEGSLERDPDALALIMYTSGSTGRPKGVEHSYRTIASSSRGLDQTVGWRHDDRLISYLPLAHTFERAALEACSIYSAFHVFFAESLDTFVADLRRARPTIFQSVPRLWLKFQLGVFDKVPERKLRRLLRIPLVSWLVKRKILRGLGLDATRLAVSGSAPIPPELIQWYRDLGLELLEGYAMSENFTYSHLSLPRRSRVGYVGHALPEVEVRIGENDEVLVKSPASMVGYHRDPALTAEAFTKDGFLQTGDRGEIDTDGRLRITGRVKELFKTSKGKYIAPVPIENEINADSRIEQSCVMGSGQPRPFAVVLLAESLRARLAGSPELQAELETELTRLRVSVNARLAGHEQLEFLAVSKEPWLIENGFLTPTMKIKRSVLEERYAPKVEGWYSAPRPVIWES
jgi:long-subunit acyl-CoA synthetase (AMP-forming)